LLGVVSDELEVDGGWCLAVVEVTEAGGGEVRLRKRRGRRRRAATRLVEDGPHP